MKFVPTFAIVFILIGLMFAIEPKKTQTPTKVDPPKQYILSESQRLTLQLAQAQAVVAQRDTKLAEAQIKLAEEQLKSAQSQADLSLQNLYAQAQKIAKQNSWPDDVQFDINTLNFAERKTEKKN